MAVTVALFYTWADTASRTALLENNKFHKVLFVVYIMTLFYQLHHINIGDRVYESLNYTSCFQKHSSRNVMFKITS